ncbi:DUF998 domain-containing protein [Amycolatopsis benzoatilytica]|uniref:DUF998 domain-containing protein n=1 Tax=Amycolatopsis benzoatilytica TaxID=346045 RepID=UPI00036A2BFC|nr:DUF998 domain-containing protein [Amycolatopsis benzoatilytica]
MTRSLVSAPPAKRLAWWAIGLTTAALSLIGTLSLAFDPTVDPYRDPVSDYALHRAARIWFALAILLVLAAGVVLAAAARATSLPAGRATIVLFGLWGAALVVELVFQGNATVGESTFHGTVHRIGGAVLFGALPLACASLAQRLRARPGWAKTTRRLTGCAIAGLITAAGFGAAQFAATLPAGLLERIALTAELVILITGARAIGGARR